MNTENNAIQGQTHVNPPDDRPPETTATPESTPPPRVALYTRVSTDDQAKEGLSLDAQRDRLTLYAKAMGWHVVATYQDEGKSATGTKRRRQYQKMMANTDLFDRILVVRIDRIHRNLRNFQDMLVELKRKGKAFVCVTDQWDTSTPTGSFIQDLMARFAQWESEMVGQRIKEVIGPKLRDTTEPISGAVYGYVPDKAGKTHVVDARMKAAVLRMFAWARQGYGLEAIARKLNESGHRTRRLGLFSAGTVAKIMTSPGVTGARWTKEHPKLAAYEAIIEPAEFLAVTDLLRQRAHRKNGKWWAHVDRFRALLKESPRVP